MAATHIALLRGINVGRAKRVPMADLRDLFTSLGYRDVRTLLNSGNVVFTAPRASARSPEAGIEKAFATRFGFSSRVTVLTAAEVAAIAAHNPLHAVATDHSRMFVTVLNNPGDRERLAPLLQQSWDPDALALGARVAYVWCSGGMMESSLAETVNRALGDGATSRNWATMTKLAALVTSGS